MQDELELWTGKRLTLACALIYGIKRRWFGLEPDFLLRKRCLESIQRAAK